MESQMTSKGTPIIENPYNEDPSPGRTIYAEPLRRAEEGWTPPASDRGERVVRREGDVEADEMEAARAWLRHVEAGRIG